MGTWIVSPEYQFANGAAYPVRTDEDVTFMGCRVRAVGISDVRKFRDSEALWSKCIATNSA